MSRYRSISSIKRDLISYRKNLDRGSINQISEGLGIGQSTVSRILKGDFKIVNSNVIKICKYANIAWVETSNDGSFQNVFTQLIDLWDGTSEMEKALTGVLQGLRDIKTAGKTT